MRKRMKAALGLLAAVLFTGAVPVSAAETPELYMQAEYVKESDKEIQADCMVKNGDSVTNGKVRIFYDAEKVKLVSSEAGKGLGDAMCEINDCLEGNKKEGELVAAFASSGSIEKEGAVLTMKFQLDDSVKDGDKITFTVKPEKMAGESGDFDLKEAVLEFEAGKEGPQTSVPGESDKDEDKDEDKDKDKDKDKDTDKDKGGSSKKPNKVKTGDETEVGTYVALGAGTGLIILICAATAVKKRKKNQ